MTGKGVGARVKRKEDDRYLRGRGEFVGDIALPGMQNAAFVRSPFAHARIVDVRIPEQFRDCVYTADALTGVRPIRSNSGLPGFKPSDQPVLATDKVRHVGEPVAVCVAPTRAQAEDIAAQVEIRYEELVALNDMLEAREERRTLVHEEWGDNIFLETFVDGDIESIADRAAIRVTREIRTSRQCMAPLEGRGVLAHWNARAAELTVYTATQMPHIVRTGLSECLGLPAGDIRVVAPDVGGGFGYKGILLAEEVSIAWLARARGHAVRWLEDRREQLTAGANCREHHYSITGYADREGRLLAVDCVATVDSGAYSAYPFSACLEAAQVASILPGPYDFPRYRCRTYSVATNKVGILPYRGVARTGVCFALELLVDAVARAGDLDPVQVRLRNLVKPEQMPFTNITRKLFDSGDYPRALQLAAQAIDVDAVRARQRAGKTDGRRLGVGFAVYCEQAAHGTSVYHGWGIPMVPGFEQAFARVTPDGGLELKVGVHSHGQSLETTLAQVAHEILGVDTDAVKLVHGDTGQTPYSTGTWGSRSMVMAGGAVAAACRELKTRALKIGSHLLDAPVERVAWVDAGVQDGEARVSLAEIAHVWYRAPQRLPQGVDRAGLETTAGYRPDPDSGTFSYGAHAAVVAVDTETGWVEVLDYAITEDGGKLVNPMIVDGQIYGGMAQGIGTALYEEMVFDRQGQPLASTLADYLLPGATEVPEPRLVHMETLSPFTEFGVKGIGEGGAIAPPAAIANAVNDALRPFGVELTVAPITPRRVVEAINAGRTR